MSCLRRLRASIGCGLLAGGLIAVPLGGTTTSQAVNRITSSATRGVPTAAPAPAPHADLTWVPDRWIPVVGQPSMAFVPGHWEQRIDARRSYAPPTVVVEPNTGVTTVAPAGVREQPPAERIDRNAP